MKNVNLSKSQKDLGGPWKQVLDIVRISVSTANFSTWFAQTFIVSLKKNEEKRQIVEVGCPSSFVKDTLERRYFGLLQDALNQVTEVKNDIVFLVRQNNRIKLDQKTPLFDQKEEDMETLIKKARIPDGFSFENFAVSSSNQLAWAASDAVAKNPAKLYNPLFLWGGVGVGKTHLAIATSKEILRHFPDKRVLYTTGDEFIVGIIDAIRTKTTSDFKRKYRKLDVIVVDDIQFIAGKDTVQDEFFHTFNALQREAGQIIMTSDKPPSQILKLENRLQSRFEAGLLVDIEPPDFELRVAILLIKAKERGLALPIDFAQKIASVISQTRRLEGFLVQLISNLNHRNIPISQELIGELLAKEHGVTQNHQPLPRITARDIIDITCDYFSISKKNLINGGRRKTLVIPRQILMYFLRTELDLPFKEIGRIVGGKDHTTIMYGVEKVTREIIKNSTLGGYILGIKKRFWG